MKLAIHDCRRVISISPFLFVLAMSSAAIAANKTDIAIAYTKAADPASAGKAELQNVLESHSLHTLAENLTNTSCAAVSQELSVTIGKSLGMFQGSSPVKSTDAAVKEYRADFTQIMKSNIAGNLSPSDPIVIAHPRKFLQDLGKLVERMHKDHFLAPSQISDDQTNSWPPASSYKFVAVNKTTVELIPLNPGLSSMYVRVENGRWRLELPVRVEPGTATSAK